MGSSPIGESLVTGVCTSGKISLVAVLGVFLLSPTVQASCEFVCYICIRLLSSDYSRESAESPGKRTSSSDSVTGGKSEDLKLKSEKKEGI